MKTLITILALFGTSIAFAHPFDSFVGDYQIVGTPLIQKSGDVKECLRFGFNYLTGITIAADTRGYKQSHMIHFNFNGGSIGHGWSGHPVMDYKEQNDGSINNATSTGGADFASNELFMAYSLSVNQHNSEELITTIRSQGSGYTVTMKDSYVWTNQSGTCLYQANLTKK